MTNVTLPSPRIQARKVDPDILAKATANGLHPVLARIIAARPNPSEFNIDQMLDPKLKFLDNPLLMQDMSKASKRLASAIINGEVIGLETDHDCDGQTAHAVLFYNLIYKFKHPQTLVRSYIGHRLNEGYGLSQKVATRILEDHPKPTLVITADNGSSDEERIKLLKENNIDVIVTDHHQLPNDGPPRSAYACLNPTRKDCAYPDPYIAGCMVAWLLIAATRQELIAQNQLSLDVKINDSLDFVAVGTIADCVSMARSYNNRAIVNYGLKLINAGIKPCWLALNEVVKGKFNTEDLAFKVGPLLNSDGRLASAFGSVSFLLAENDIDAKQWVKYLQTQNIKRKEIQNNITQQGMQIAVQQVAMGRASLCIFLAEGHAGVHGISASRIKDSFGRPTVFLAPKFGEENILTGSIRSIEGFHVGDAIQWLLEHKPGLLLAGGGHAAAGGITLYKQNYQEFADAFESIATQCLQNQKLGPVVLTDGELSMDLLNLETLYMLQKLEPFGREFDTPVFEMLGVLSAIRTIGDGTHARLEVNVAGKKINAVWFNFNSAFKVGDSIKIAYSMRLNDFNGRVSCDLQVIAAMHDLTSSTN